MEAAVFDLLTRQKDRNSGNIVVSESGNIKLIDNGRIASPFVNSVLFPSTSFHAEMTLGKRFIQTGAIEDCNEYPLPGSRLDYRCHSKGLIGKSYPSGLKKCMQFVEAAPLQTLSDELGLESEPVLTALQQTARLLLDKGFEWTLANTGGGTYPTQDPCCDMIPVINKLNETSWSCGGNGHFDASVIQ